MAVYTHLTNEVIAEFLQRYPVGELQLAVGIAQGVENSNYLLETAQSDGAIHKYILTLYEKRVNADDLPFFMGLMEHLAEQGVVCPLPIHSEDGAVIQTLQERPAAMISFLQGRSVSAIQPEHTQALGAVIAQMHVAVESFAMRRDNDLALGGWQALYDEIVASGLLPATMDAVDYQAMLDDVAQELAFLAQYWPSDLPRGIIHGDLFPDNVFFEGKQLSGVIDFYFACEDMLALDLAICLNCWCFEPSGEFNMTKAQRMLRAYHAGRALGDAEIEALPVLARGAALRFLLTRLYDLLHHDAGALVTPKDPTEYWKKLRFHQQVNSAVEYGW